LNKSWERRVSDDTDEIKYELVRSSTFWLDKNNFIEAALVRVPPAKFPDNLKIKINIFHGKSLVFLSEEEAICLSRTLDEFCKAIITAKYDSIKKVCHLCLEENCQNHYDSESDKNKLL